MKKRYGKGVVFSSSATSLYVMGQSGSEKTGGWGQLIDKDYSISTFGMHKFYNSVGNSQKIITLPPWTQINLGNQ